MSGFDVFEDDPLERQMKSHIAGWFRDEQARKLEQARSLAVSLEAENAKLAKENASLERALWEADREVDRLQPLLHDAQREIDRLNRHLEIADELLEAHSEDSD
jgi:septal ring factor EnvC (AmiA/AmiB activator)